MFSCFVSPAFLHLTHWAHHADAFSSLAGVSELASGRPEDHVIFNEVYQKENLSLLSVASCLHADMQ